jgi:signal transduction histidine kinase/Tfp pilus assembly protein PilF
MNFGKTKYLLIVSILIQIIFSSFNDNYCSNKIDSLLAQLEKSKGIEKADILNQLAEKSTTILLENALKYSKQALDLSINIKYDKGKADAYITLAFYSSIKRRYDEASSFIKSADSIYKKQNSKRGQANVLLINGLFFWSQENFKDAMLYLHEALKLSRFIKYDLVTAKTLNYIGLVYWKWGDYANSLKYLFESLQIKENLDEKAEQVITLNNIARSYNDLGNYSEAVKYASKAYKLAIDEKYVYGEGRALNNLGVSYRMLRDYKKSEEVNFKSLEVKIRDNDKNGIAYSRSDLGDLYSDFNKYDKAFEHYEKALKIRKLLNNKFGIASTLLSLGKLNNKIGNKILAEAEYIQSLKIAKEMKFREIEKDCYESLFRLYDTANNPVEALRYLKLFSVIKDTLFNVEVSKKIAEQQISYELLAKEKEIKLLTQEKKISELEIKSQNIFIIIVAVIAAMLILIVLFIYFRYRLVKKTQEILEEKNQAIIHRQIELVEINAAKDKFFSLISHDLRSPFSGLLGYAGILKKDYNNLSKEEIKSYVDEMFVIIEKIHVFLEDLLTWSKMQIGNAELKPENISLRNFTDGIIDFLKNEAQKKDISIINEIDAKISVVADNNTLRSILYNLMTNAIKFSNPGGEIKIFTTETEKEITISVKDNGVGISKEDQEKLFRMDVLFSTSGTASERGTGLGLILVNDLVAKNNGKISVESEIGKGSIFNVTFPKDEKASPSNKK